MHNLCIVGSTPYAEASPCTIKRPIGDLSSLSLDVKISSVAVASQCNVDSVALMYQTHNELFVETSLELYVLDLRAYLFLLCDDCPDFASFLYANTCNGVADIIFACLRLEVIHRVSFCKIPRARAMEGEGGL